MILANICLEHMILCWELYVNYFMHVKGHLMEEVIVYFQSCKWKIWGLEKF